MYRAFLGIHLLGTLYTYLQRIAGSLFCDRQSDQKWDLTGIFLSMGHGRGGVWSRLPFYPPKLSFFMHIKIKTWVNILRPESSHSSLKNSRDWEKDKGRQWSDNAVQNANRLFIMAQCQPYKESDDHKKSPNVKHLTKETTLGRNSPWSVVINCNISFHTVIMTDSATCIWYVRPYFVRVTKAHRPRVGGEKS